MAPPVAVLGMDRSVTGNFAGSLEAAGLHLGEVVTGAPHNRKGNREGLAVRALNDRLLEHNGGLWDRPPSSITWDDGLRTQRAAVIAARAASWRWGFKDARTVLTLVFWQEGIPDLALVGTFRHPHAVATSLARRDSLRVDEALALWTVYDERLPAAHDRQALPVISFDLPSAAYADGVAAIAAALDLPGRPGFFSGELRHHGPDVEAPLPPEADELYQRLLSRAGELG